MRGIVWKTAGAAVCAAALILVVAHFWTAKNRSTQNPAEQACLDCHRRPNINTNEGVAASRAFCDECHRKPDCERIVDGKPVSLLVKENAFRDTPHQYVACVHCHVDVARSPHRTAAGAQCMSCHTVHGEGDAHAPHLRVQCQACHFRHESVRLDPSDNRIKPARVDKAGLPVALLDHGLNDLSTDRSCRRCHDAENQVGAPAAILPAKSLLCVMCHPASWSMGHPVYWAGAVVFLLGMALMVRFWFIGAVRGEGESLHRKIALVSDSIWDILFSRRILTAARIVLFDIILQRRILKESVQRWAIHSLIFLPILARLLLSLATGLIFALDPDGELALALIDKNNIHMAFIYDALGISILLGVIWALIQRFIVKPAHVTTEIQDNITLFLVGSLVAVGFLTTGARLLLTQIPGEIAIYSFMSYPVSQALALLPVDWRTAYPCLWWVHAALAVAFVAYLPFGKLKHIFNTPLTYLIEELTRPKKGER